MCGFILFIYFFIALYLNSACCSYVNLTACSQSKLNSTLGSLAAVKSNPSLCNQTSRESVRKWSETPLRWSQIACFGLHPSAISVFFLAKTNCTKEVNTQGFDSNRLHQGRQQVDPGPWSGYRSSQVFAERLKKYCSRADKRIRTNNCL